MKFLFFLFLIINFTFGLTLKEIKELAIERHIDSIKSGIDLKKIEEKIKEVKGSIFPKITFTFTYTRWDKNYISAFVPENKYFASLILTQPIFDKSLFVAIDNAKKNRELQEAIIRDIKVSISAEVEKIYWAILLRKEIVKEKEESLKYWEDYYKLVEEKYKEGIVPIYELFRAKSQLKQARAELIKAKAEYKKALNSLKSFLGISEDIEIEGTLKRESLDLDNISLENNTLLEVLKKRKEVALSNAEFFKSEYYPKLSFFARYNVENIIDFENFQLKERIRSGYAFGVQADFVIFEGFKRRSRILQEKLEAKKYMKEIEFTKIKLKNELDSILTELKSLEEEIKARKETVFALEVALRYTIERYREGVGSQIEILEARKAYEEAKISYLSSIFNYNSRVADLKKLLGILE